MELINIHFMYVNEWEVEMRQGMLHGSIYIKVASTLLAYE